MISDAETTRAAAGPGPMRVIESPALVLADRNIDTDQIIPARFLSTTTRHGLGAHAFEDWRRRSDGSLREDCALNDPRAPGCRVIVAGRNFGCGSSREHAAWALADMGVRVVISSEIADIFASNAVKNGILPITVGAEDHRALLASPFGVVRVDLERSVLGRPDGEERPFEVEAFTRYCLLNGLDHLGYLLDRLPEIERFERARAGEAAG